MFKIWSPNSKTHITFLHVIKNELFYLFILTELSDVTRLKAHELNLQTFLT
ncbi:hypothetical protein HanRHA438_Chr14g0679231 [Helianthus annuus]|nr:hypothetical protein HanRHA438_Chr14g0679231 [Helianthus annuus]